MRKIFLRGKEKGGLSRVGTGDCPLCSVVIKMSGGLAVFNAEKRIGHGVCQLLTAVEKGGAAGYIS